MGLAEGPDRDVNYRRVGNSTNLPLDSPSDHLPIQDFTTQTRMDQMHHSFEDHATYLETLKAPRKFADRLGTITLAAMLTIVGGALVLTGCDSETSPTAQTPEKSVERSESATENTDKQAQQGEQDDDAAEDKAEQGGDSSGEPGSNKTGASELADDMDPDTTKRFGGDFTVDGEAMTLGEALEKGPTGEDEPIKVSTKITKVCQKKGCWFKMTDASVERSIRVRMQDYDFFIPRNTAGGEALVQGYLQSREVPAEEVEHYASDQGKDIEVDGPQKVVEFMASAVEISL